MYQLSILDKKEYHLLDWLSNYVNLDEKVDKEAMFIQAIDKDRLAGVVGWSEKREMPRLEHIILIPEYQRTRLGVILLKEMEKYLRLNAYKEYYSYILNGNKRMISYAQKWGLELKTKGQKGSWYYKTIKEQI